MKKLALFILYFLSVSAVMAVDLGTGVEFFPASRNIGLGTKTAPERLVVKGSDRSSTNPSIKFSNDNNTSSYRNNKDTLVFRTDAS